jgi:hypothetical protein
VIGVGQRAENFGQLHVVVVDDPLIDRQTLRRLLQRALQDV